MTRSAARSGTAIGSRKASPGILDAWEPGPHRPRLASGSVHVWRADLRCVGDEVLASLCAEERERAARFPHERDGLLWARARGVLRGLIGRYLDVEPSTVQFRLEGHGKPSLWRPVTSPPLSFNLSHSGPLALYAFSQAGSVGVDVQSTRARRANEPAIAARALGAQEGRRLAGLRPPEREPEFLRAWARVEATLKCAGAGLWARGRANGGAARRSHGRQPWVIELAVGGRAAAALAVQTRPQEVRCLTVVSSRLERRIG